MTTNNAQKEAIRARMSMTGEPYNVARRKLSAVAEDNLTVWELGEDGEAWFVEGTLNQDKAYEAVKQWIIETTWIDPKSTLFSYFHHMDDLPFSSLDETRKEARDDWFWKPVDPSHPHSDAYLARQKDPKSGYQGEEIYTGVHLEVHY